MRIEIETLLVIPRLEKVQRFVKSPEVAKAIIGVKNYIKAQEELRKQENEEMAKLSREEKV